MSQTPEDQHSNVTPSDSTPQPSALAAGLPFALSFFVVVCGLIGFVMWKKDNPAEVENFSPLDYSKSDAKLESFELTERSGKKFRSEEMRGDVWVVSYFYTSCPGSCKKLNTHIRLMQQTDPELAGVKWLSISVDPVNDSVEMLQKYADQFQADSDRWLFCRGPFKYVQKIGQDCFKLPIIYKDHSDHGVIIDRNGKIRGMHDINSRRDREILRKTLIECLAETVSSENPGEGSESKSNDKKTSKADLAKIEK